MHPILFELGPLTLRSYGLMMALGFAFGILLSTALRRKEGVKDELVMDVAVWIMAGAVLGARLMYVAVQPEQFRGNPWEVFAVWQGGLVYYGGLIGGGLTAYFWLRRQKQAVWKVADILAPGLALGQVFGRFGCYLNGCCYGREDAAHGIVFPSLGDNIPHLPVQLYEAGFVLALAAFLVWLRARRRYEGQVFWTYVALYAAGRFALEALRGDVERGVLLSSALSPGQWTSLAGLALAALFHFTRKRHEPA